VSETSEITEAFGVTFGTKVNLSAYPKEGIDRYQFVPKNPLTGLTRYYFKATPKTGLIYRVGAEGVCESDQVCNERLAVLLALLKKKYGEEEARGFMDQVSDRHEIRSGGRCIVAKCTGFADVTIELYYNDDGLEKQANEEDMQASRERAEAEREAERKRIELESKKLNGSGL
jgi:hypothetical protein